MDISYHGHQPALGGGNKRSTKEYVPHRDGTRRRQGSSMNLDMGQDAATSRAFVAHSAMR